MEEPLCTSSGCPNEVTRVVPVSHCAETQGGIGGGTSGHPLITQGLESSSEGMVLSVTEGLATVGCA